MKVVPLGMFFGYLGFSWWNTHELMKCGAGAGQDVGRSCIILTIGGKNIMLDCGMHMGYNDVRRFPDFKFISSGRATDVIDAVLISHFHLDHCGALPYFSEVIGCVHVFGTFTLFWPAPYGMLSQAPWHITYGGRSLYMVYNQCRYDGPIFMTHPTKAICPVLLEDYRKITVERKGETDFFTRDDIKNCMKKVSVAMYLQVLL
jgi:integrator complex subunit 11